MLQSHDESFTNDELTELAEQSIHSEFTASDAEEKTPAREIWDLLSNDTTIITQIRDQFIDNKPDHEHSSSGARPGNLDKWRTQEFFSEGGSTNSVENRVQREWGSGSGSPQVRGSGGSRKLVQGTSFHTVTFS